MFGSRKDEEGHPCLQDSSGPPTPPCSCSSFRRTIKSHLSVFSIKDINSFYGTDKPFLKVSHASLQSPGGSALSAHGVATPSLGSSARPQICMGGGRPASLVVVVQSCQTLCYPIACPSPSPRASSNSVHRANDAIQPSHPLSSPSPAFNLSHLRSLFQGVNSLHQVAKVLKLQLQHQSFQ